MATPRRPRWSLKTAMLALAACACVLGAVRHFREYHARARYEARRQKMGELIAGNCVPDEDVTPFDRSLPESEFEEAFWAEKRRSPETRRILSQLRDERAAGLWGPQFVKPRKSSSINR